MKIIYWRRITQIIFFILIIYGGFLIAQAFSIEKEIIAKGTEDEINLLDISLPIRTCRYIEPKPTLFESCGLRYLLNRPIYRNIWIPVVLFILIILAFCFVFGRFMCGWMCPLGFVSDILDYSRKKLKINRITFNNPVKKILKYWRYSFLIFLFFMSVAIILPFLAGIYMSKNFSDLACQVCPARTIIPLFGLKIPTFPTFLTPLTAIFSTISLIFLGIYLTGVIITRPWCTICPNGSFTSLFNKGCLITKEKDIQKCTKCGICKRVCPFTNTEVFEEKTKKNVDLSNCINCFNCVDKCPEDDCLKVKFLGKTVFKSKFRDK